MIKNSFPDIKKMRFKVKSKRRLYIIKCKFDGEEYQYELDIIGVFGKVKLNIGGWTEINIETNPLDFAREQIERFEKQEDYLDEYGDGLFYLNEEAEQAAQEEERRTESHAVIYTDWETGKKAVFKLETEKKEEKTS